MLLRAKNWTVSPVKLCTNVRGSATKCKTGSGRPKTAQTVEACMELRMLFVVCNASTFSAVRTVFSLLLPVLSFVKNFADPVTVHAHEYVYTILLCSTSTFSVNLAIIFRNVIGLVTINFILIVNFWKINN